MSIQDMIQWIVEYGYLALFILIWLGFNGTPIPDDVITMVGGWIAGAHILPAVPTFLVTYLAVISALTFGYGLGRWFGPILTTRWATNSSMQKYIEKSTEWMNRYGAYALCFSYLLPVIRHLVPSIAGIQGMSYKKYAFFSYLTGFIWTGAHFALGYWFGDKIEEMSMLIEKYGQYGLLFILCTGIIVYGYTKYKKSPKEILGE